MASFLARAASRSVESHHKAQAPGVGSRWAPPSHLPGWTVGVRPPCQGLRCPMDGGMEGGVDQGVYGGQCLDGWKDGQTNG